MKLLLHPNISLLILLAFTLKEPEPFRVRLNVQQHGDLTIVDSTGLSKGLKFYRREEPVAYYPIFYLGKRSNMLSLGRNPISSWISAEPYNYGKLRNWELSFEGELKIKVDTAFQLAIQCSSAHYDQQSEQFIFDSLPVHHAYPVVISNESDSLIQIGSSNVVFPMILQIQMPDGKWIRAEDFPEFFCGVGRRSVVLEPGQMAVAKFIRHSGQRKVLCRLRFTRFDNEIYSNTFYDWIDDSMLKKAKKFSL